MSSDPSEGMPYMSNPPGSGMPPPAAPPPLPAISMLPLIHPASLPPGTTLSVPPAAPKVGMQLLGQLPELLAIALLATWGSTHVLDPQVAAFFVVVLAMRRGAQGIPIPAAAGGVVGSLLALIRPRGGDSKGDSP